MSPFEIFIVGAIVVGFVAKLIAPIWDSNKHKVKNELLKDVVEGFVRAGEEMELSGHLGGKTKYDWVADNIMDKYPQYKDDVEGLDALISAAVQAAGLGATEKKRAGTLPKKK
jgi:hypothetical protein